MQQRPARPLALAATLVAAALATIYGGFVLQGMLHVAWAKLSPPVLMMAPLGYLLFMRAVARGKAQDSLGPRVTDLTALFVGIGAPVFAAHAHLALSLPIIKRQQGKDPVFISAALTLLAVLVTSVLVAAAVARRRMQREPAVPAVLLRVGAKLTIAAALAMIAVTAISPRPPPYRWMATLPAVAWLDAPRSPAPEEIDAGPFKLRRSCGEERCGAWLLRPGDTALRAPDASGSGRIALRRDEARDLWVVDASEGAEPIFVENGDDRAVFRGPNAERVAVRPGTLTGSLSPPRGWIVTAAIGAALAIARLAQRRAAVRRLDAIVSGERGTADEDGWITIERAAVRVRAEAAVAAGPVVVLLSGAAGSAYRSEGARAAEQVIAGDKDELAVEARRAIRTIDAGALSTAAITAAPLAVAFLEGLR